MFRLRLLLLAICAAAQFGCHSGHPLIPVGWKGVGPASPSVDAKAGGKLQVFICYGAGISNHAALRIECAGQQPLFWDPGGRFGTVNPKRERMRCLVIDEPPTVGEYWNFRTGFCGERWMEMFEWDLPATEAAGLRNALYSGRNGSGTFDPFYPGLACAIGISRFLDRCARPRFSVPDAYFMPHALAAHLWTQHPSRVWEFRYPDGATVYSPP